MGHAETVYIVDNDPTFRASLACLLRAARFRVESFSSAQEFLDRQHDSLPRPACLILDISLPGLTGVELQDKLVERRVTIPVIFVSAYAEVEAVVGAMKSGAVDYFKKPYDATALLERIRHAIDRDARLCEEEGRRGKITARLASLTPREREVLDLLMAGAPPRVIAIQLGLSRKTVNVHRGHIMSKLDVRSFADLVKVAHLGFPRQKAENHNDD